MLLDTDTLKPHNKKTSYLFLPWLGVTILQLHFLRYIFIKPEILCLLSFWRSSQPLSLNITSQIIFTSNIQNLEQKFMLELLSLSYLHQIFFHMSLTLCFILGILHNYVFQLMDFPSVSFMPFRISILNLCVCILQLEFFQLEFFIV